MTTPPQRTEYLKAKILKLSIEDFFGSAIAIEQSPLRLVTLVHTDPIRRHGLIDGGGAGFRIGLLSGKNQARFKKKWQRPTTALGKDGKQAQKVRPLALFIEGR